MNLTHLWSPNKQQRRRDYNNGEKTASSISGARTLDSCIQKDGMKTVSDTIHKNTLRWIKDLNLRPGKIPREKHRQNTL